MAEEQFQAIIEKIKPVIVSDKSEGLNQQPLSAVDLKDYLHRKYPNESAEQIKIRVLDHMKAQFCNAYARDEDESMKTVSSPRSEDSSNPFNCLAGESQPLEEEEEYSPSHEDVWDSLIATIQSQVSPNKGKGPAHKD